MRPACTVDVSLVLALPATLRTEINFEISRELRENWPHQSYALANIVAGKLFRHAAYIARVGTDDRYKQVPRFNLAALAA